MLGDPTSVFLWMVALTLHRRIVDDEVDLGELLWGFLQAVEQSRPWAWA